MDNGQGFGFYIDRTLKKVSSTYLNIFRQQNIDLTMEQWVILNLIDALGENASQSEISEANYRNRATTSRVIAGLEKKNLISKGRFTGDNKRYHIKLTKMGKKLVKKTKSIAHELRTVGRSDISKNDFKIFLRVLDQIWDNYDDFERHET